MTVSNGQVNSYPEWEPHAHPAYDVILGTECDVQLQRLRDGPSSTRREFLADPRAVHKALYSRLTPLGYDEYAGTYRGTVGTTLASRCVASDPFGDGPTFCFAGPEQVEKWMESARVVAERFFALDVSSSRAAVLGTAAQVFYAIGSAHPFLDGNGHIQRLAFAACIFERPNLELLDTWSIHIRPYGEEMVRALAKSDPKEKIRALSSLLASHVL